MLDSDKFKLMQSLNILRTIAVLALNKASYLVNWVATAIVCTPPLSHVR